MSIADLIHIFYKAFGADSGRLIVPQSDSIEVRVREKSYVIDKALDCWQNTGHGRQRGTEEKRISALLMRAQADWLDPEEKC
jgi:hypothetical protein